jgi:GNAT superfamily N-acetyltransferase
MSLSTESAPPHEIVIIAPFKDPELWDDNSKVVHDQCYQLRDIVYRDEQGFPQDSKFDECAILINFYGISLHIIVVFLHLCRFDAVSATFLLRLIPSLEPVGTIRAVRHPDGYYKLTRMIVLKPYRKLDFGKELIEAMHAWIQLDVSKNPNYSKKELEIACYSQLHARGFYAKYVYLLITLLFSPPLNDEFLISSY